jgi:type IV secretory pathway VirB6-like protein
MTTATAAPRFETHSRARANLRALALVVLFAALTYGFLSQVWSGPTERDLDAYACNPKTERCA